MLQVAHLGQKHQAYFNTYLNFKSLPMPINIEKNDLAFNAQLKNFAAKINKYSAILGITPAEVASLQADAAAFDFIMNNQAIMQTYAQTFTSFKNDLRKGEGLLGVVPAAPGLGTVPTMPAANVEGRFRNLVQRMIKHPAYKPYMGEDLGIEAAVETFTATEGKPKFTIELTAGGYPNLRWTKGKFQGVEIWKDSGKGFAKLDRDMVPDYPDKSPLPPEGQSAVWRYRMIYLMVDEYVGTWSEVVSVTVHGSV